ncbi:hypothetical protein BST61_g7256 [Cercospora zeina]
MGNRTDCEIQRLVSSSQTWKLQKLADDRKSENDRLRATYAILKQRPNLKRVPERYLATATTTRLDDSNYCDSGTQTVMGSQDQADRIRWRNEKATKLANFQAQMKAQMAAAQQEWMKQNGFTDDRISEA